MLDKHNKTVLKTLTILISLNLTCSQSNTAGMKVTVTFNTDNNSFRGQQRIKNSKVECPSCRNGGRYFYKLINDSIVLCCEECSGIWLDSNNLEVNGLASNQKIEETFDVRDCEELFDPIGGGSRWAKEFEVQNSIQWNQTYKISPWFLKKKN
jgi:hypothetical protein